MKKICFICPSLYHGGLQNAITVLANEMASRGHVVSIICLYKTPVFYSLDESINIILPTYSRSKYPTFIYYFKSILFLRYNLKIIKPDVAVSYGDYINPISILSTVGLKTPIYISDRSSPGKNFPFMVSQMRKFIYPLAKGIIAQTETAKQQKIKMLGKYENIQVIPNPIRPLIVYNNIPKEKIILGVGRHYEVKGFDRLIKAFAKLSQPDWKLLIAGSEGPHTNELNALVKNLNLIGKVEFLGPIKEIDKLFQKSKIFVLPSRSEGFPNALIEAMANGLACVSFDINAGPSDVIINKENGFLIKDGDIDELANKIDFLITHEEERLQMGQNAKKLKDQLSLSQIADLFFNFVAKH